MKQGEVISFTKRENFQRSHATSSTDTSFATKSTTTTMPSGDGVIAMSNHGADASDYVSSQIMLLFFGTDAANETFDFRVYGWEKVTDGTNTDVWIPAKILAGSCILGTLTGQSSTPVLNTDYLCDTISSVEGTSLRSVYSPADNTCAHLVCDSLGFNLWEIVFDSTGSASACALFRRF